MSHAQCSIFRVVECHVQTVKSAKGEFPVMAKITLILAANIPRQFFFVITTTASTRCLVQNFQLICYSQRVNATSQYNDSGSSKCHVTIQRQWQFKMFKMAEGSDGCSRETLLAPCRRKKRLQRKMTKDNYWIGVQENIRMFGNA